MNAERIAIFEEILDVIIEENADVWNELLEEYKKSGDGIGDNEIYEEIFVTIFALSGASDIAISAIADVIDTRIRKDSVEV